MIQKWSQKKTQPSFLALIGGVLAAILFLANSISVLAHDTEVGVTICNNQPPEITILSPYDGEITPHEEIVVGGVVQQASSLTIDVNNEEIAALATKFSDTFMVSATLIPGVNTIEVNAQLSCNNTESSTSLLVWYNAPPDTVDPVLPDGGSVAPDTDHDQSHILSPTSLGGRIWQNLGGGRGDDQSSHSDTPAGINEQEANQEGQGKAKLPTSYVVVVRSWLSLLLASGMLVLVFLPKKYYRHISVSKNQVWIVRLAAVFFWLLFMFVLQL